VSDVAVIGGGPAGLMAADVLSENGIAVDVYDAMPSVGRKFLMAGKGGLNITHSEPFDAFSARYGDKSAEITPLLQRFGPENLREWVHKLGVETFVGTSGRVFPAEMKAAPLLRAWIKRLRERGVRFHMRHKWLGWSGEHLVFATPDGEKHALARAVVLSLGGKSWAKLGSTGDWDTVLHAKNVLLSAFKPSNCGFNVHWSTHLAEKHAGEPVKPVMVAFVDSFGNAHRRQGELVITSTGIEGSLIYAFSAPLRDTIAAQGSVTIKLDLVPGKDAARILKELSHPRGSNSMANHLRKRAGITGVQASLLRECVSKDDFNDPRKLAAAVKALPVKLESTRPIDEAISTAGGVAFEALDENLMIKTLPGVFCAGEMLDWEAPTGGYLLTACFASGRAAGFGALSWIEKT